MEPKEFVGWDEQIDIAVRAIVTKNAEKVLADAEKPMELAEQTMVDISELIGKLCEENEKAKVFLEKSKIQTRVLQMKIDMCEEREELCSLKGLDAQAKEASQEKKKLVRYMHTHYVTPSEIEERIKKREDSISKLHGQWVIYSRKLQELLSTTTGKDKPNSSL